MKTIPAQYKPVATSLFAVVLLVPVWGCATHSQDSGLWNQPYRWERDNSTWTYLKYPEPQYRRFDAPARF